MKFPRLKHPLLCQLTLYTLLIGGCVVTLLAVAVADWIPDVMQVLLILGILVGALVYVIRNFIVLLSLDMILDSLHCRGTARKWFVLPKSFDKEQFEAKIRRYHQYGDPAAVLPRPEILQYKSTLPIAAHASGIERIVAVYSAELLDMEQYRRIVQSAAANAKALQGARTYSLLDKHQRKSPVNQVTVIFILSDRVDGVLRGKLSNMVTRQGGEGYDTAVLPCVLDLEQGICTFDSLRISYTAGFQYPMKNRGIRLIRRLLFGGRFPYADSPEMLDPPQNGDLDPEQTLWSFWKSLRRELILDWREMRKRFEGMAHKEVVWEGSFLYLKWNNGGIRLSVKLDPEAKLIESDAVESWIYPHANQIGRGTIKEMEHIIQTHFAELGYTVRFREGEKGRKS